MKFSIVRDAAVSGLSFVMGAVATSGVVNPILRMLLVEAHNDCVIFRGTNTIVEMTAKVQAKVTEPGRCCVDSILAGFMAFFEEGDVTFSIKDKLVVSQGSKRHVLSISDASNFPAKVAVDNYVAVPTARLLQAFRRCAFAASSFADRPVLQSFYVNPRQKFILASDGNQVSLFQNIELPGFISLPSVKAIDNAMVLLRNVSKVEVSFDRWVGFRTEDREILVNTLSGEFPSKAREAILSLVNKSPSVEVRVGKDALIKSLELCDLYSRRAYTDGKQHHTVFNKNGSECYLTMDVPDFASFVEPLSCQVSGVDKFTIFFHPGLLLEAVNVVNADLVVLKFYDSKQPFLVLDESEPDWLYLQVAMASSTQRTPVEPKEEDF